MGGSRPSCEGFSERGGVRGWSFRVLTRGMRGERWREREVRNSVRWVGEGGELPLSQLWLSLCIDTIHAFILMTLLSNDGRPSAAAPAARNVCNQ